MLKTFLQDIAVVLYKKTARKKTPFLKSKKKATKQRLSKYSLCKIVTFGQKLKIQKNMLKTILQEHYSCSVQKFAGKNTKY